jgi:O-methyltransferase
MCNTNVASPGILTTASTEHAVDRYLDLMKRCLSGLIAGPQLFEVTSESAIKRFLASMFLYRKGMLVACRERFDPKLRDDGRDIPVAAETAMGLKRLTNLELCVRNVVRDGIPGDLIETGVWRGGAVILMRAVLKAYGITDRNVYVADSFQGLPKPSQKYHWEKRTDPPNLFVIDPDTVRQNFAKYDLLDGQVHFLVGWFKDTLPNAPFNRLAVMRLDGVLYESTIDALNSLYHKLSTGGYCIVDDYNSSEGCRKAVDEFRDLHGIKDPLVAIDWTGVYWRKTAG